MKTKLIATKQSCIIPFVMERVNLDVVQSAGSEYFLLKAVLCFRHTVLFFQWFLAALSDYAGYTIATS
jgi:hypothetical protein